MKLGGGTLERRRVRAWPLGAFFATSVLAIMLTACGISLDAGEDGSEIFEGLTVEGDFSAGGTLTLILDYAQPYPVDVDVECILLEVDPESTATPEVTPTATSTPVEGVTPMPVAIPRIRPTPAKKVLDILAEELAANPQDVPPAEATPVRGTIEESFTAPERPGRYKVKCLTPDDDNNSISKSITITAASAPRP
jgi:hypothetical protein